LAIIGTNDAIFPPANQLAYWTNKTNIVKLNWSHFPFFEVSKWSEITQLGVVNKMNLANKEIIKKRFTKSLRTYDSNAAIQKHITKILFERAKLYVAHKCDNILEIGCGTGFLSKEILENISPKNIYLNDIVDIQNSIKEIELCHNRQTKFTFLLGDAEDIVCPQNMQAVFSASTMQWFANLPKFISKVSRILQPQGIFAFNTFGPQTFSEIKGLLNSGLIYPTIYELKDSITPHFEILEVWEENHTQLFESPLHVLRHLQKTGVTATNLEFRWTKTNFQQFENDYKCQFSKDNEVTLTWQVYYFICKNK
jgi:malonyl-ACP O-methyltransferase BioC